MGIFDERFPGIDWHCDRCGAYLNSQEGFDDHKYLWKCTECGIDYTKTVSVKIQNGFVINR